MKISPAEKKQYQPEDLSLKGYYGIAALSVTTGIVIVGILNLATPLEIIADRLALVSRFSGPFLLLLIPPFIFIPAILVLWIVISAVPWLGGYLSGQVDLRTAVIIFARTSMVGLISAFVASHLMETYSRRKLIPFFFPRGRLVNVEGTFRISISRRIQLLNPLGTLVPGIILLVTLVTLQWKLKHYRFHLLNMVG